MSKPIGYASPIAVIGGSGLYQLFDDEVQSTVDVTTPYGTVRLTRGLLGGREAVFLPRHGSDHSVPPHLIPSRATIWALASLGVRVIISTAAVGSLNPDLPIGAIALADQLVDRTHGRADSYFDGSMVRHLPFADPFGSARSVSWPCPRAPSSSTAPPSSSSKVLASRRAQNRA